MEIEFPMNNHNPETRMIHLEFVCLISATDRLKTLSRAGMLAFDQASTAFGIVSYNGAVFG